MIDIKSCITSQHNNILITLNGQNLFVPVWTNWVCMDRDGEWWAFEAKPILGESCWLPGYESSIGCEIIGHTVDPQNNWRKSLQEVIVPPDIELVQSYTSNKTVMYFGINLVVPNETKYLTIDKDGNVMSWTKKPSYSDNTGKWNALHDIGSRFIAEVNIKSGSCKASIMELP